MSLAAFCFVFVLCYNLRCKNSKDTPAVECKQYCYFLHLK